MPPRLSHSKSCDEKRPKCGHCTRHNVTCEWPSLTTRIYNPRQPKATALSRSKLSDGPRPALPSPELGSVRVLELRLIHHWITVTANTMSSAQLDSVHHMWSVSVPQLAFEHEPLLHTLLAIGAAHRAILVPQEANALRPVYHGYMDSAVRRHRPVTGTMDDTTCEAVCLNAILISLYTLFLRSEPSNEPYEPPLMWLSMARGIRTVLKTVYHQLLRSISLLSPLLEAPPIIWDKDFISYKGPIRPFQYLLHYRRDEEQMDEETVQAYNESVAYLERFYISLESGEPAFALRKMFSGFPPVIPIRFQVLVANKVPRALIILAYLFALAKRVEDIWWLIGIPEREVRGINTLIPSEWKWAMVWPLDLVSQGPDKMLGQVEVPSKPATGESAVEALF
ncbi:uncharacterized protein N7459_002779 [Penicillium hispanicum]|uniref:uncharacterized protein n=1 Tax=Penicillium hispanicum TaxID=1080232 RepID=UPI002542252D|nr:uncharacterized protein N7459_002779 [Penicillium hispanicum]KAJ5587014.1 hypothetical protein N7459_002779 [Penicillium hispanicum]